MARTPTTNRPITLEDVFSLTDDIFKKMEVVNGDWNFTEEDDLLTRFHGGISGLVSTDVLMALYNRVVPNNLGEVFPGMVGYILEGDKHNIQLMRVADVSFVKREHLRDVILEEPFYRAPDLAVEVLYRDYAEDLFERIHDFLTHGTEQVWVISPALKNVQVFLPDRSVRTYGYEDVIPGGELFPEATFAVREFFRQWLDD